MIDITSKIKFRLAALDCSLTLLATLAAVSKTRLSDALNGMADLGTDAERRLDRELCDLEAFVASVAPLKVDLRDANLVTRWLEDFRAKRARAEKSAKVAPATPTEPDPFSLLAELVPDDFAAVCKKHSWSQSELLRKLTSARTQLEKLTAEITDRNDRQHQSTIL